MIQMAIDIFLGFALLLYLFAGGFGYYLYHFRGLELASLRAENERLLTRIGYEYGLYRDRPFPRPTDAPSDPLPLSLPSFFRMRPPPPLTQAELAAQEAQNAR